MELVRVCCIARWVVKCSANVRYVLLCFSWMIGYAVLIGRGPLQIGIDGFCGSSTSLISLILKEKGV